MNNKARSQCLLPAATTAQLISIIHPPKPDQVQQPVASCVGLERRACWAISTWRYCVK